MASESDTPPKYYDHINRASTSDGVSSAYTKSLIKSPPKSPENTSLILSPRGSAMQGRDLRFKYISALKNNHGHLANTKSFL